MASVTLARPVVVRETYTNAQSVVMIRTVRLRKGFNDLSRLDPDHAARVLDNFVVKAALPKPRRAEPEEASLVKVTEAPAGGPKPVEATDTHGRPERGAKAPIESGEPPRNAEGKRTDGPTVAEYVAAGYQAADYPPGDFASRSTEGEIKAAIDAQKPKRGAKSE